MAEGRPDIPAQLRREVLVEAGHRCAIPTCRATTTEIAHIDPWSKVQKHEFPNLIALCPNCHTRFDRGEIDRKSMLQYKLNLGVVLDRYGDLEVRVLESIGAQGWNASNTFILPSVYDILLWRLIQDGFIYEVPSPTEELFVNGEPTRRWWGITQECIDFVERWFGAEPVDAGAVP